ncbi:MAG: hypothetical protein NT018_02940 [Armatimonadetes bacterium]|nr:hypothetical protein [Armatimonadota bacterium]
MSNLEIDVAQIKKLVEMVEAHGLEELTVEDADLSITVKGRPSQKPSQMLMQAGAHIQHVEQAPEIEESHEELAVVEEPEFEGNIVDITAALVGVFYRAAAHDAPNFVEIGDTIEIGSEVGLIEAMKVFSPIPSEVSGVVVDIPCPNAKLVQQGEVLVRVRVREE